MLSSGDLEQQRRIKYSKLKNIDLNQADPLSLFVDYISWTEQHFPSGHVSIQSCVQDCCRTFRKDSRFKNDPRYVKLWIRVAHQQDDPVDLFKYLSSQGIGLKCAIFYAEYHDLYVARQKYDLAHQVLKLGIENGAEPMASLENRLHEFEQLERVEPVKNEKQMEPKKFKAPKNASFQIYQEEEKEHVLSSHLADLDISRNQRKENEPIAEKWAGQVLKQPISKVEKLEVFKDQDVKVPKLTASHTKVLAPVSPKVGLLRAISEEKKVNPVNMIADMRLCYINGKEYSFEETRAASIGFLFEDIREQLVNRPASPTINTKAAMADVFEMFHQPLDEDVNEPDVVLYYPEDDETISRKVYRPENSGKMNIFRDDEAVESSVSMADRKTCPKVIVFNDSNNGDDSHEQPAISKSFTSSTPATNRKLNQDFHRLSIMTPITELSERTSAFEYHDSTIFEDIQEEELEPVLEVENPCDPRSCRLQIMTRKTPPPDSCLRLLVKEKTNFANSLGAEINLNGDLYSVVKLLGKGAYGCVYQVQRDGENYALKIQTPPSAWEYYVLYQMSTRLIDKSLVPRPICCTVFQSESLLVTEYLGGSSLLDVVNRAQKFGFGSTGGGVDELLAMFWTLKLLKTIKELHQIGIIHGDVKIDNVMLKPSKSDDLNEQGLVLIDFGSSIDLNAFQNDQMFQIPPQGEPDPSIECPQLINGTSFKFEPDYYGIASISHVLLFGDYLQVTNTPLFLVQPLKRYWNPIWHDFFSQLLNGKFEIMDRFEMAFNSLAEKRRDLKRLLSMVYDSE